MNPSEDPTNASTPAGPTPAGRPQPRRGRAKSSPIDESTRESPGAQSAPILERFSLAGRSALVTGGARGIGHAYCQALGQAGASVAIVDVDAALADEAAHGLIASGIDAIAAVADVTDRDQVSRAVQQVADHFGSLTIGINNAGIGVWEDAESMQASEWRRVLSVNLDAVFWCAQAEAHLMLAAGYGKIINTASMSGSIVNAPQNQAAYNTSKAGVIHLTRSLAAEWAPRGVLVNCISPGYTRTKLMDDLLETPVGKEMMPQWVARIPLGRVASVTDLQGGVVYLASAASDYLTGHDLVIDGGYSAW